MRYLTKSRFKLGMECPRKLYYHGKKDYANQSLEDSFLEALAEGGFQIGELAKLYYPGGYEVTNLDYEKALEDTNKLLKKENIIIYEAAIKHENLFSRVDILIKEGNKLKIIEVKSKSIKRDESMEGSRIDIKSGWLPYVEDIAFQKYLVEKSFPQYEVAGYLLLADKDSKCPSDGLNQKFKISKDKYGRKQVKLRGEISKEDLSEKILIEKDMDELCQVIYNKIYSYQGKETSFSNLLNLLSNTYKDDIPSLPHISRACRDCEFKVGNEEVDSGLKSGFNECFKLIYDWEEEDFKEDNIFDLWDNRRIDDFIRDEKLKLTDLTKEDIGYKPDNESGLTRTERQWLQISKSRNKDKSYYIDKMNLKKEMDSWKYPLHFIDFETAQPVIPFKKGKSPYEGIAFQFSHHIVYEDGSIEHKNQYLNTEVGVDPNYDFLRKLKEALDKDKGTIFRYSNHENTYLNKIYEQLQEDKKDIEDREELSSFIRDITEHKVKIINEANGKKQEKKIEGSRNMVDMLKLVQKYYYDPCMKGSNSIKMVLPSVLNSSDFLKKKYSKPIYGSENGIKSLNFEDEIWVQFKDGQVVDPYQLLPKLFSDMSEKDCKLIASEDAESFGDTINHGGIAMMAYYRLQFEDIEKEVRSEVEQALLKYCELDTLAMVMIYEAWLDMIKYDYGKDY